MICHLDLEHTIGLKGREIANPLRLFIKGNGNLAKGKAMEPFIITTDANLREPFQTT